MKTIENPWRVFGSIMGFSEENKRPKQHQHCGQCEHYGSKKIEVYVKVFPHFTNILLQVSESPECFKNGEVAIALKNNVISRNFGKSII